MKKCIAIGVVALFVAAASIAWSGDLLRCVVLDVGEGQAVLLQRDSSAILVDTGHFGQAANLRRSLGRYGVKKVEAVILTHLHADHATGVFAIMDRYPEAVVYESGHRLPFHPLMDGYRWVAEKLDSGSWERRIVSQGERIVWRGVGIHILWPSQPKGEDLNASSLVLEVNYGEHTILIMGDVNRRVEAELLAQRRLPENIEVLVVGHHGAADGTSSALLDRVSPAHAVVSINADNLRGYPDAAVMEKLDKAEAQVHEVWSKGDFVYPATSDR